MATITLGYTQEKFYCIMASTDADRVNTDIAVKWKGEAGEYPAVFWVITLKI